jgi:hypothetical protein
MDLKDFVADVISQITDGVIEAINRHDLKNIPGRVNPAFQGPGGEYDYKRGVQNIDFDISVTVSAKKEASGGFKVSVLNLGGAKSHEDTTTNKIKFTIPVSLPHHSVPYTGPARPRTALTD